MKTLPNNIGRIRLRIETAEQSEQVQKICINSNIKWISSGLRVLPFSQVSKYIIIDVKERQMFNIENSTPTRNTDEFIEEYISSEDPQKPKPKRVLGLGWIYTLENGMEILVPEKENANLLILKEAIKEDL